MSAHFSTRARNARSYVRRKGNPWPSIADHTALCHECGAPFEPICSTYKCPARRQVLTMLQVEQGANERTYYGTTPEGWGRVDKATAARQRREAVEGQRYAGRKRAGTRRPNARRSPR